MRTKFFYAFLIVIILLNGGCSLIPSKTNINPTPTIVNTPIKTQYPTPSPQNLDTTILKSFFTEYLQIMGTNDFSKFSCPDIYTYICYKGMCFWYDYQIYMSGEPRKNIRVENISVLAQDDTADGRILSANVRFSYSFWNGKQWETTTISSEYQVIIIDEEIYAISNRAEEKLEAITHIEREREKRRYDNEPQMTFNEEKEMVDRFFKSNIESFKQQLTPYESVLKIDLATESRLTVKPFRFCCNSER